MSGDVVAFSQKKSEHYYPPSTSQFPVQPLYSASHQVQESYFLCASIHYTPDYSQSCSPLHHFLSSSYSFLHPLWFRSLRHSPHFYGHSFLSFNSSSHCRRRAGNAPSTGMCTDICLPCFTAPSEDADMLPFKHGAKKHRCTRVRAATFAQEAVAVIQF